MNDDLMKSLTNVQKNLGLRINVPTLNTDELLEGVRKKQEEDQRYREDVLKALRQIELNTANLSEIVSLLHSSNENQNQIFDIVVEMLSIAKEKDQQAAQSKYRKVMEKIGQVATNAENLTKLYGLGTTIYGVLHANGIL